MFLLILILFPLYYLITTSLISPNLAASGKAFIISDGFNFNNYQAAFNNNFWSAFGVTLSVILLVIFLRLVFFNLFAFGLKMASQKYRKVLLSFLLIVSLIPENSLYFYLRIILSTNGFLNKNIILALSANLIFSYFLLILTYNSLQNVQKEQEQLARVDNLPFLQKGLYLYFPQLKSAFLLVIIFSTIQVWNDALWPQFVLSSTNFDNIFTWFSKLDQGGSGVGVFLQIQAAGSVVIIFIPLVIYLINAARVNKILYHSL